MNRGKTGSRARARRLLVWWSVLTLTDVTKDPTAKARARIREERIAEARAEGFEQLGWVSAVPVYVEEPTDDQVLIDLVMVHRDGGSILEMAQWRDLEDIAVRTLFDDGSVVLTGRMPDRGWWKVRWGLASAPEHGFEMEYVKARTVAELVARHEERVLRHRANGNRSVARHGMRAYLATRKRWREIADVRAQRQHAIAKKIALTMMAMTAIAGTIGARIALRDLVSQHPATVLASMLLTLAATFVVGLGGYVFSMHFVAAVLARKSEAPPRRDARELLALADSVPRGRLPSPTKKHERLARA